MNGPQFTEEKTQPSPAQRMESLWDCESENEPTGLENPTVREKRLTKANTSKEANNTGKRRCGVLRGSGRGIVRLKFTELTDSCWNFQRLQANLGYTQVDT